MQFWKKSTEELKQLDCFLTIDELPIKAWFDIHKTGDYSLLLKNIITVDKAGLDSLFDLWKKMYNEYMSRFGLSDQYKEHLDKEIDIAKLKAKLIITGARHLKTLIRIKEQELMSDKPKIEKPLELEVLLARMSKSYGFKLESKELTVTQYYSYLNVVNNGWSNKK